jgi:hypothetical protein
MTEPTKQRPGDQGAARVATFLAQCWGDNPEIGDDAPILDIVGYDLTFGDMRELLADRNTLCAQLSDALARPTRKAAHPHGEVEAERNELRAQLDAIAALEVHGGEFVDAAALYRILGKPIPPPIDHAENIRRIAQEAGEQCGKRSKSHRIGGILGPCVKPPGHDGWHLDGSGAAWDPATDMT